MNANLLSREALAFSVTGYTITGRDGAFGSTYVPARGCQPAGPYTLTDEAGRVVLEKDSAPLHVLTGAAVRHWRARGAACDDGITAAGNVRQLQLQAQIRALEAQAAALEVERVAIDTFGGDDLFHLDQRFDMYAKALRDYQAAVHMLRDAEEALALEAA